MGNGRSGPPMTVLRIPKVEKAIRQPVGVSVCIGSLLYAGVHGKVRFYDP